MYKMGVDYVTENSKRNEKILHITLYNINLTSFQTKE